MSTAALDFSHDPAQRSWVASANDPHSDFPLQNLPFGRFRLKAGEPWRVGVAIGEQVLDLQAAGLLDGCDMNTLMARGAAARRALRHALSSALAEGSSEQPKLQQALHPQSAVELGLPCTVGDYTDFYVGIHHATAVGKLFRPDNPLLPNYPWVPIGYHGRASTLQASGHAFRRPMGQLKGPQDAAPALGATRRLDFELELALCMGQPNALGEPIAIAQAEDHIFGLALLNDWSARDVQAWEYQPLGPFLSKNFATTLSPWMVTLEALAPFRKAFVRAPEFPQPLPYLDAPAQRAGGAFDIQLDVLLQTPAMRASGRAGVAITRSNYADAAFWTAGQLVTHHTVNGCALNAGDVLGTGTLSGPEAQQAGSLLELTQGGKTLVAVGDEQRSFVEDGDTVILRGWCEREGLRRIGFGNCAATVLPAR